MDHAASIDLYGLVLAGGMSTRLGRDKARLLIEGRSLLARSVGMLKERCAQVYISGRDPLNEPEDPIYEDVPWLPDDVPGQGPIGGITTALKKLKRPLLVLACDLPLLPPYTLDVLIATRNQRPPHAVMTTFQQRDSKFIEALVAIYEPESLPLLKEAADQGFYKLSRAVPEEVRWHIISPPEREWEFLNINYPRDLERMKTVTQAPDISIEYLATGNIEPFTEAGN